MSQAPLDFDLIIIGSGPAGEKRAARAAYFGMVFNIPTLGDACKYAACDGLQALARTRN